MPLKKIGALWKKSDKHGKDYLTGQLDLGVLGKVQIAIFQVSENRMSKAQTRPSICLRRIDE